MSTINIDQVKTELGAFFRVNNKEVAGWVYRAASELFKHCRTITKVKGKFPAIHSVAEHVVQGFQPVWNEMGSAKMRVNELTAYHQKVNFPIVPAEILGSWLAEMDEEDKSLEDKSISRYIAENVLKPKVTDDVSDLVITAEYDAARLDEFGYSMNGLIKILEEGIADTSNPMFKIPLTALTDSNIVEQVTAFERGIPKKVARFVKKIFMSTSNLERYILDYESSFGANTLVKEGDYMKTRLGKRQIIGIDEMEGSDLIFATVDGNMLKLIDKFDEPTITDIQKADYKLKIFMEFWLGVGFWTNQMVFVSTYDGSEGLGSSQDTEYYPAGPDSGSGSAS